MSSIPGILIILLPLLLTPKIRETLLLLLFLLLQGQGHHQPRLFNMGISFFVSLLYFIPSLIQPVTKSYRFTHDIPPTILFHVFIAITRVQALTTFHLDTYKSFLMGLPGSSLSLFHSTTPQLHPPTHTAALAWIIEPDLSQSQSVLGALPVHLYPDSSRLQ